jgi:hypothetical protein
MIIQSSMNWNVLLQIYSRSDADIPIRLMYNCPKLSKSWLHKVCLRDINTYGGGLAWGHHLKCSGLNPVHSINIIHN